MGASSSIRSFNEGFLTRISTQPDLYNDFSFFKSLFETLSPFVPIPDLSQVVMSQPSNISHICQLSTEFLEVAWLQVEELSSALIRSCENSLNFMASIVPVTIELNKTDLLWEGNMRAYRIVKAALGLFSSHFFGSSGPQVVNISLFTTHTLVDNSQICNKRREMILKLLVACLKNENYAFKVLITRDIVVNEEFLVSLLESLTQKNQDLVSITCRFLAMMLSNDRESEVFTDDVMLVRDLLKQRKKSPVNIVQFFFKSLSDENINKVLYCILLASATLENSSKIEPVLDLLCNLFTLNADYCKYIALNKNISIISSILASRSFLEPRAVCKSFSSVFYSLSHYREFSISLNTSELNLLLEFIFKLVLAGQYEHQTSYPLLLGTFCNISAFIIDLNPSNSQLLTLVIEYLTDKSWLLSSKSNHINLFYIVQGINNLIQYQWEGCSYLVYYIVKKKESFYKIIRMQVDTPDEVNLDDKATDGEMEEESLASENSESDQSGHSDNSQHLNHSDHSEECKEFSDSSGDEVYSEQNDRVIGLERINEGLILGLNAHGPDEIVQRTSYLNTHVSTFDEDVERRNTVQHIEAKQEDWKPTPEWMLIWKTRLPLKSIFVVIKEMFSVVIDLQEKNKKLEEIVEEIGKSTLVGVLPRPHPIYLVLNLN